MDRSLSKNITSATTPPPPPTVGSIEIGLIIMGMSCICVVACALIILQLRSIRRQRQRRQRQRSSTVSVILNNQEVISTAAPPSYETVIRNPHLYPVSPRSSVASINSIKSLRRASEASGNSSNTRADSSSGALSQSYCALQIEDLEDPPPAFPGLVNSAFLDERLERSYYSDTDSSQHDYHRNARNHRGSHDVSCDVRRVAAPGRNRSVSVVCGSTYLSPYGAARMSGRRSLDSSRNSGAS